MVSIELGMIGAPCSAQTENRNRPAKLRQIPILPPDHDEFGSNRSKLIVIDSNNLERDSREKPAPLFRIPLQALAIQIKAKAKL
jgi:hypothetical protein